MTLHSRHVTNHGFYRAAIVFSGGPAPAANAVISTAAVSFLRSGIEVYGIRHGYSSLENYDPERPLQPVKDYLPIDHLQLKRTRNTQGIMIGTARANPGRHIDAAEHLADPDRSRPLKNVYDGLCSLGIDALVSIGGDDTLRTANKLYLYMKQLPAGSKRIPIVHVPKTIDNDYTGIDFTFGYFTAVDVLAQEVRNLLFDAESSRAYFIAETMGRSAGWLAYGTFIAGEGSLVISVEDVMDDLVVEEYVDNATGETKSHNVMKLEELVERIVRTMLAREEEHKHFGVIVLAEGLAEYLPHGYLGDAERDPFGHINFAQVHVGKVFAELVAAQFEERTKRKRKITALQLGYEARCARPSAFDVILGSQLGVGAYRALVEEGKDGFMVSVEKQLDLIYEPFSKLVHPVTLVTNVRHISRGSDFYKLARFLETNIDDKPPS